MKSGSMTMFCLAYLLLANPLSAQGVDVRAHIQQTFRAARDTSSSPHSPDAVVWLNAIQEASGAHPAVPGHFRMEQKNKRFHPHLLVVPIGSTVEFPNLDPFFHNVFSQFNGKRFDLGLYETGNTRGVRFDHEGVSYIFCNIHSQMAAVIVALATPYFATPMANGLVVVRNVPPGDYEMHVWAEGANAGQLGTLARRVHVGDTSADLGSISLEIPRVMLPHKNKFGDDYAPDRPQPY